MKADAEERKRKIEKANRMEQSWELLRISRVFIKKNSPHWERSREQREEERRKKERLQLAKEKQQTIRESLLSKKVGKAFMDLPESERRRLEREEEKRRRI